MAVSPTGAALARRTAALPIDARQAALVRLGARLGVYLDVLLAGSLVLVAAVVRWPNLLLSPQFSSGGTAIPMALDIADGRAFYLREVSPYIGGPYHLAAGAGVQAVRAERRGDDVGDLGDRRADDRADLPARPRGWRPDGRCHRRALLATSAAHTVITSHVPISHSVTPLVSTTTLWLIVRAVRRAASADQGGAGGVRGRLLALAGFLGGLTLQTHPTAAPLLVGAGAGALLMRREWLRTRWPAIALACAILGYSSLLVYHVTSGFAIVADIQDKQGRYLDAGHDVPSGPTTAIYPSNLGALLLSSARLMSGTLDEREGPADFLDDPWVLAPAALALVGLAVAAQRRAWWLIGAVALAVVLPPAFNGKYRPILDGRFLMPLLPVLFVALGLAVTAMGRLVMANAPAASSRWKTPRRLAEAGALTALIVGTTALDHRPAGAA